MDKKDIIKALEEFAQFSEIKGENPFKIRAYENAARALQGVPDDINELVMSGKITDIKGIGKGIARIIIDFVEKGVSADYAALKDSVPSGIIEMLKIPGMGPKKVKAVSEKLGIKSAGELEYACHENRLIDLEGFGEKTQRNILRGIEMLKSYSDRHLLSEAKEEAERLFKEIEGIPGVIRVKIAGSIRRWKETVKDIDILVSAKDEDHAKIMDRFISLSQVKIITAKGDTKSSVTLTSGINADLRIVNDLQFPYALHHFTGSKEHNTAMRGHAKGMHLKMNEYGLFKEDTENIPCRTESDIFMALGMGFIPPELREGYGEIEAAIKDRIPDMINFNDIKGAIHVHSHYSDGIDSIQELVSASQALNYEYLIITDHSKSANYANGLSEKRILQQHEEIDSLNRELRHFRIFKGIECDILADGSLDYPDNILQSFDIVIASIHYKFNMTEEEATQRILTALKNPYVTMLGHPTGRLLLAREGYPINMNRIIQACAEWGVAIELNANPHRLDIDWRFLQTAKSMGAKISINPDAHRKEGLKDIEYGVGIARKGWLTKREVLNCLPADKLIEFANTRRNPLTGHRQKGG